MRANERTDERVAQYFSLYSCLFQTTVTNHSDGAVAARATAFVLGHALINALVCGSRVPQLQIVLAAILDFAVVLVVDLKRLTVLKQTEADQGLEGN